MLTTILGILIVLIIFVLLAKFLSFIFKIGCIILLIFLAISFLSKGGYFH